MTSRDFCYWLQGYFEIQGAPRPDLIAGGDSLTVEQVACIKAHLSMVFVHEIDPSFGGPEKQAALDVAHLPKPLQSIVAQTGGLGLDGKTPMRC